jgi:50S ribosomal protein L16 3-hydroxylase
MKIHQTTALLNGLSPAQFMQKHWQKKPLLVRQAVRAQDYALSVPTLLTLAAREDMQSRYIAQTKGKWQVIHGPFDDSNRLPISTAKPWTVLVQGANHQDAAMHELMQRFRFVPDARLDDVMVSYATPGGGVGPHVDSYDVFLLQLKGTRRWRMGPLRTARDKALVPGAPLKLLQHFKPTQQYDLAPGDMLYLPPGYGHDGVAIDECLTASIGFRAPRANELVASLLEQLADVVREADEGVFAQLYSDTTQSATRNPARLPDALPVFLQQAWQQVKPSAADFEQIVGSYLSEPKAHVMFEPVKLAPLQLGFALAPTTLMMYGKHAVFINGETLPFADISPTTRQWLKQLAELRMASVDMMKLLPHEAVQWIQTWWQAGYFVKLTTYPRGAASE